MNWKNYTGFVLVVLGLLSMMLGILSLNCLNSSCMYWPVFILPLLGILVIIFGIILIKSKDIKK